jgi:hypothetical protein
MNCNRDRHAEEVQWCEELAEQLAAARQEVADARAKALVDARGA